MIFLVVLSLTVLGVRITTGNLDGLARLHLRRLDVLLVGFVIQTLVVSFPGLVPGGPSRIVHVASYGALAAFLWCNRHVAGMGLVALGGAANLAAILANGGVMPASAAALRRAGMPLTSDFANSAHVAHARLGFLGDVFAIPRSLPLANVFSIGDVILAIGFAVVVARAGRSEGRAATLGGGQPAGAGTAEAG